MQKNFVASVVSKLLLASVPCMNETGSVKVSILRVLLILLKAPVQKAYYLHQAIGTLKGE